MLRPALLAVVCVMATAGDVRAQSQDGAALFTTYCASCHGATGRGTGPVAVFLRVPPADLTQIAKRNNGAFPADRVYRIIDGRQSVKTHGNSQMPIWGDAFSKSVTGGDDKAVVERIKALVTYLGSIQERPAN
jgi:mono/diheme cytochrome c family protein